MIKKRLIWLLAAALVLAVGGTVGGLMVYSANYSVPELPLQVENHTGLVQAVGRGLYDAQGNLLQLQGVNAGQILLQEGWMSPFALEPLKNEDGSYVKDADGNIQYPEFTEEEFRAGIRANPNLNTYDMEELLAIYRSAFFTEEDFRIIKQGTPGALYPHHGKYLLQPESGSKPVGIIIDLVQEHAEISADTFLSSLA